MEDGEWVDFGRKEGTMGEEAGIIISKRCLVFNYNISLQLNEQFEF